SGNGPPAGFNSTVFNSPATILSCPDPPHQNTTTLSFVKSTCLPSAITASGVSTDTFARSPGFLASNGWVTSDLSGMVIVIFRSFVESSLIAGFFSSGFFSSGFLSSADAAADAANNTVMIAHARIRHLSGCAGEAGGLPYGTGGLGAI